MENEHAPASYRVPFEFTGKAGEYFKIWIVNILLTLVSLGIYSAWAKVRTKRYIYGNASLDGSTFDYLADPVKILKGRLIVLAFFVFYVAVSNAGLVAQGIFGLFILVVFPWVIVRALAFRARNTAYRNIRFDFRASYRQSAEVFIGGPFLVGLTLGIAYPYFAYLRSRLVVDHSGYGITPFTLSARVASFFRIYLMAGAALLAVGLAIPFLLPTLGAGLGGEAGPLAAVVLVFVYLGMALVVVHVRTSVTNLIWSNTSLGDHEFESTLETLPMLWLYLSNAIAILLSAGLLVPWATMRMVRYRLDHLTLLAASDLDEFVAGEENSVAAAGEEIVDFLDFDVGI